jgi:integrase
MFSTPKNKRNPSYLVRNPHSYCFRMIVPKDLRHIVGKQEVRLSLKTGFLSVGKSRARLMAGLIQQLFGNIRSNRTAYRKQKIDSRIRSFLSLVLEGSTSYQTLDPLNDVSTSGSGPRLKLLVEEYFEENLRSNRWSPRTVREYRNCFRVLLFYFGDVSIGHLNYKTLREYKRFLLRIPANFSKMEKYSNLSPAQLMETNSDSRLSVSAVSKYLWTLKSFFTYALKSGYVEANFASGLQLPPQIRADEQRSIFTPEDLEKLFHSDQYIKGTHRHPYQFWLPLLGLYTGCRIEELCQLHVEDVREVDDLWVLDINDSGERRLKNKSSRRLVPLHSALTDQFSFPAYVEGQRSKPVERVFPELRRVQHCFSHGPSKWFGRYKRQCGIVSPPGVKTFHSFRHTLVTHLKQKQVPEIYISELVGHSIGGELSRYGKRYEPGMLYKNVILKIDYQFSLETMS